MGGGGGRGAGLSDGTPAVEIFVEDSVTVQDDDAGEDGSLLICAVLAVDSAA